MRPRAATPDWQQDTTPPDPATSFSALPGDGQLALSWNKPEDPYYVSTRILRSTTGYAGGPTLTQGQTQVYEGSDLSYTAFVKDTIGLWSTAIKASSKPVPAKPTTLTLTSSRNLVEYNGQTTLTGRLSSSAGNVAGKGNVAVQRSIDGGKTWTSDGTAAYNAPSQTYRATRSLQRNATFRLRFVGDPYHTAASSSGVAVKAKAFLTRPVTPDSVRVNVLFTVSGFVEPQKAGTTRLHFYRYEGGAYKLRSQVEAKNAAYDEGTSKYTLRHKLPYAGRWMVKAYVSDTAHASTWSPEQVFVVSR